MLKELVSVCAAKSEANTLHTTVKLTVSIGLAERLKPTRRDKPVHESMMTSYADFNRLKFDIFIGALFIPNHDNP